MKVPFSWLKQYVDIDVTAQELEDKLFGCGFEVEELIDLGGEISKVVVGVVTECVPQEGTHLHICKVDCGDYGHDIQISTGASNVYAGMHTAAALDGSTLPGGITIKAKPLMGIESNGMLCSGEELGLNDDLYPGSEVYGLLDLPKDTVPGTPIQEVVGLNDYIFDISITANRADCQSAPWSCQRSSPVSVSTICRNSGTTYPLTYISLFPAVRTWNRPLGDRVSPSTWATGAASRGAWYSAVSCRCAAIWGDATPAVTAVITASANTPKIRRLSMKNHPASCFANSLQGGFA
mgnify:CR=1 FL=1